VEQQPAFERRRQKEEESPSIGFPIGDNRVQIELMKHWGEKQNIPISDVAREWAEGSLASVFRQYAEEREGERIDTNNKPALDALLNDILEHDEHKDRLH